MLGLDAAGKTSEFLSRPKASTGLRILGGSDVTESERRYHSWASKGAGCGS